MLVNGGLLRLPDKSGAPGDTNEAASGESRQSRGWLKKLGLALIPLVIGASLPTVISHIDHKLNPPKPRIEVDSIRIGGGSLAKAASVQVLLRNTGNQLAVIKGVRLQIERTVSLPICLSQGDLGSSYTYGAAIPAAPKPGTVVDVPVHQQEAPGSADNFTLRLHLPKDAPRGATHVYFMSIALQYDNTAQPVQAGHLLLALPLDPDSRFIWMKGSTAIFANQAAVKTFGSDFPLLSRCLIKNSKVLAPMLQLHGSGPTALLSLRSKIEFCCVQKVPAAQVQVVLRSDCPKQKPAIRPGKFLFDCDKSTGTEYVDRMNWTQWDAHTALGTGVEFVNDCDGNCPVSKFQSYPVVVKLSQPVSNNVAQQDRWKKVTLTYPDTGPLGLSHFSYTYLSP